MARDVTIEIRLKIAGADWYSNGLNHQDVLTDIRDALDDVLRVQRYQSIKVKMDKEEEYGNKT